MNRAPREFQYECGACHHRWLARKTDLGALLDIFRQVCPACGADHWIIAIELPQPETKEA